MDDLLLQDKCQGLKIYFFGDAISDTHQIEKKDSDVRSTKHQLHQFRIDGGIILLARMIIYALLPNIECNFKGLDEKQSAIAISSLEKYPFTDFNSSDVKYTYRVNSFMGFLNPTSGNPSKCIQFSLFNGRLTKNDDSTQSSDFIIINDEGIGIENQTDEYQSLLKKIGKNTVIIYKMHPPTYKKRLWKAIKETCQYGNWITVVNIEALRDCGADISKCLSWERTAEDFNREIMNNPSISFLQDSPIIVLKIRNEGAIRYSHQVNEVHTKLYFDPFLLEGEYDEQFCGVMQSSTNAFIAGFIQKMVDSKQNNRYTYNVSGEKNLEKKSKEELFLHHLDTSIPYGIYASRKLLALGFEIPTSFDIPIKYPLKEIFKTNDYIEKYQKINSVDIKIFPDSSKNKRDGTSVFESFKNNSSLNDKAIKIVTVGIENMMDLDFPVCFYGNLVCVDRTEIESYQIIKNLIIEYTKNSNLRKPLSIAVFGPPGSGKSFGIDEVTKSIKGPNIRKIAFNLSQFTTYNDLVNSFHIIRDCSLEGDLPLVFFDEFDCDFDKIPFGWLKFFLQPMQDGSFKGEHANHPLGRAIFIFAGGTCNNFKDFKMEIEKSENKSAKVKDFISRLRGYIDIVGCDYDSNNPQDQRYKIRRAIILRSLINRFVPQVIDKNINHVRINEGVLHAFLNTPKYYHGVRSLQAIIEMSILDGQTSFEPSALPPTEQLHIHVDTDIFLRHVHEGIPK